MHDVSSASRGDESASSFAIGPDEGDLSGPFASTPLVVPEGNENMHGDSSASRGHDGVLAFTTGPNGGDVGFMQGDRSFGEVLECSENWHDDSSASRGHESASSFAIGPNGGDLCRGPSGAPF